MRILVLTISDRAHAGVYKDLSGPAVEEAVMKKIPGASVERKVVPDDRDMIIEAFSEHLDREVILTTGGTGLSPRDITPEVTAEFCERDIPGIAEFLRAESLRETPNAVLSRGTAGIRGKTIIVNLPGSVKGAGFCAEAIAPVLVHAHGMVMGKGHSCR
jgi:molybdenum cofactor synthesis domain-containing protein